MHSTPTEDTLREVIQIILAQHRSLDCMALASLFHGTHSLNLLGSTTGLQELVELCQKNRPNVAIIDAMFPEGAAFDAAIDIIENSYAQCVLFLDDKIQISRANQALSIPRAGYLTKEASLQEIQLALQKLVSGEVAYDPLLDPKLPIKVNGEKTHLRVDSPVLAKLTPREIQVMKLVAVGNSARSVASKLELSANTIDNHKSRLKKKLGIHKAAELTRIAMREGLID